MKKFIFIALAIVTLVACDSKVKGPKCTDLSELQEAVLKGSTDTTRFDINGDGKVDTTDINEMTKAFPRDSITVKMDTTK